MAVHFVMFVPTILGQGTLEQQGEWLGRAWNLEILGTYAQVSLHLHIFKNTLYIKYIISIYRYPSQI